MAADMACALASIAAAQPATSLAEYADAALRNTGFESVQVLAPTVRTQRS
jgi:hypothetical protein